jgi:vacuolar protein sorting-associated protein 26
MGEVVKEKEVWVHSYRMPPDSNTSIKMEVGIEDCLHIEFEYNKAKYVTRRGLRGRLADEQIPPKRRNRRQDLLPPCTHKD